MDDTTLFRAADPATSRQAARELVASGNRDRHRLEAYAAVKRWPGRTAAELERLAGVRDGQIRKRLAELRQRGMVSNGPARVCAVNGTRAMVWEVVPT